MNHTLNKNINNIKNIKNKAKTKTKKNRDKILDTMKTLTPEQRANICKNSANTYSTFEDKIDELFKKNNINIVSTKLKKLKNVW